MRSCIKSPRFRAKVTLFRFFDINDNILVCNGIFVGNNYEIRYRVPFFSRAYPVFAHRRGKRARKSKVEVNAKREK